LVLGFENSTPPTENGIANTQITIRPLSLKQPTPLYSLAGEDPVVNLIT